VNKATLIGSLLAFMIPIGFVIALNFDSIANLDWEQQKPTGKLLYFYSPT
jgi:hypothetical protein